MTDPAQVMVARGSTKPVSPPTLLSELSLSRSETPCWTCRRRRIICDKAIPTCKKCHQAGRQCLGYKKPLVWNKGVASRGKMMGKTFEEVKEDPKKQKSPPSNISVLSNDSNTTTKAIGSTSSSLQSSFSIQGALVDPIFQDVNHLTRFYLNYYAHKLSTEAVLIDFPGQNPYKDLMALIGTSPLLLKTILAVSARDFTNFKTYSDSLLAWSSLPSENNSSLQSPSKYHALSFKQSALTQLRNDLQQTPTLDHHVLFACISLFVFIEVLESGKDAWRVHLEGAKQLVQLREKTSQDNHSVIGNVAPNLNSFFFDSCITFDIMGNTLTRPYKISKPLPPTEEVFNSIRQSEKYTFWGCPADLLYLILVINWQYWSKMQPSQSKPISTSNTEPQLPLEIDDSSIISSIELFCPTVWAQKTSLFSPCPDTSQRVHIASAYKSAVLIYALRALRPHQIGNSFPIPELASQIIDDLATIPIDGPFLKCILWPTFIAGAESEVPERREAVKALFHIFWISFRSINAANAVAVLDQIWKRVDERKAAGAQGEDEQGNWYHYLANGGVDWLFV
ncbi:fungal-specific transcription factor domain-containing protein [Bisporella sp. PMI_857]|nr:fungal-specific transcription factor domain-containing protein [Bisporella sp. PMI_857]